MAQRRNRPTSNRLSPNRPAAMPPQAVVVEKMAAGGDAIARLGDGRVVFVDGALPGETVQVAVHTSKKDFAKASVLAVLDASPDRVAAPCPELVNGCGGCGWQHIAPAAQLQLKVGIVADALRRTGKLSDAVVQAGASVGPWAYRTTMRLAVDGDGRVGLRAAGSHRVVPLRSCMVAHPALTALLPDLRVTGAAEVTVRVSAATGEATAWSFDADARIRGLPAHVGVGGSAVIHEQVAGTRLRVSAASFFQSGPAAAELLVHTVRAACGGDLVGLRTPLLDAYGGIGLFAATLGAERAIVVESSVSSCADAVENLGESAAVHRTAFERWAPEPVDLAVVDPARAGLGSDAAMVLAGTGAATVVLVSCDPVSLARDTTVLAAHGYRHAGSTVLDLFPHTSHVEVVTRFERV